MNEQQAECGAIPPNVSGPIACHLSSNHEGEHFSTSGCAGSEIRWMTAEHSSEEGGEGRRCGYTVIDDDGIEQPCDRPAPYWRWYQDTGEHEDMLDAACDWHSNDGGRHIHDAEAERDDLRGRLAAAVAKWSGCWCDTQMAWDHDPRVQDCPQHGDASCRHMAEGIVVDLRAALANPSAAQGEGEA